MGGDRTDSVLVGTGKRAAGTTAAPPRYRWGYRARASGWMLPIHRRGSDVQQVEAFTAAGIASGAVTQPWGLRDDLESEQPVDLDRVTWYPLAGGAAQRRGHLRVEADDLLVLCPETQDLPIHAAWHAVELDAGPYRIVGELPTLHGFDPGRALARPGGLFVLLRDVRVEIRGHEEAGRVERPHALVNRYAVERVAADIDLGFYFPGAHFLTATGRPLD